MFGANGKAKSISEIAQDISNGAVTENALSMPGKMIPGYLLAGHSLTDILGYISAAGPEEQKALFQAVSAALYSGINSDVQSKKYDTGKFIQSIKNRADTISPDSDKAEAYDLLTSYLIKNSSLLDDSGDVQTSTEIAETQNFLASFLKSEDYKDYGFSEYDMDEKTYGLFSKVNYTENDIRNIKKRLEKYGSYDIGKQWSQIPHRLARATRFADLFDKTYKPLYEKYGEQYGFKNYEDFISQVFERNPEQGKQYKTSIALQNLQTLYPDMDLIDILRNPDIIKKGDIRPEALGGKEMTWEMMNLLNILRTSPEDFLNEQRMLNEEGDTNSIRDVLSYQLAEGKMNW